MMVVTSQTLLELKAMRPFHELSERGLVRRPQPLSIVAFVSHQWLSRSHPDPDGMQLQCLQNFLKAAGQEDLKRLFTEDDWKAFKSGVGDRARMSWLHRNEVAQQFTRHGLEAPDDLLAAELAYSYLWVDYLSVPQSTSPGDDSQLRAIYSIPYYIDQSSFFLVVCPHVQHADTGEACDYWTWQQRGWCRFEEWSNLLTHHSAVPLVLTETRAWTVDIPSFFTQRARSLVQAPLCGSFSCCRAKHRRPDGSSLPCDKENLRVILQRMWLSKIQEAYDSRNQWAYLHFRILESRLFVQSPDEPFRVCWGACFEEVTPESVVERMEADIRDGLFYDPAILIAALVGDERILQACVERGDDPISTVTIGGHSCLQHACSSGSPAAVKYLLALPSMSPKHVNHQEEGRRTPLHQACNHGLSVQALLRCRADPTLRNEEGQTPLHYAAQKGHRATVYALLASRASIDTQDVDGATALHLAAAGFRLWSSRANRLEVVECLLQHKASVAPKDSNGLTAGDVARRDEFRAAAALIRRSE